MPAGIQGRSGLKEITIDAAAIDAFAKAYRHGDRVADHCHEADQLLYASSGAMSVTTGDGSWVIPPQRAVWIPAGISHGISMCGTVRMRTLYLAVGLAFPGSRRCRALAIAPLDRELILELVRTPAERRGKPWEALARVLLDRLVVLPTMPLHLPIPRDPRARRVARLLLDDPACTDSLPQLARSSGASARTLARHFLRETRMTFGQWRLQARILAALRLLASGRSVSAVALDVGYESPSAFIAMFRRALGVSPGRYFARRDGAGLPDG